MTPPALLAAQRRDVAATRALWALQDNLALTLLGKKGHQTEARARRRPSEYARLQRSLAKSRWLAGCTFEVLCSHRSGCRYLIGSCNACWPFARDYLAARRTLVPLIKIWAYDHLCLFARLLPLPSESRNHR